MNYYPHLTKLLKSNFQPHNWVSKRLIDSYKFMSSVTHHQKGSYFLSANELEELLSIDPPSSANGKVKVLDGSWKPGLSTNDLKASYELERIPGAKFFGIDEIAAMSSPFPHMLPPSEVFEVWMENFAIRKDDRVIIYDQYGLFSAPRVLWTFKVFGHDNVQILEGGLSEWKSLNKPIEKTSSSINFHESENYYTLFKKNLLMHYEDMIHNIQKYGQKDYVQVVDVRAKERFEGKVMEGHQKAGHIPHAINIPFSSLLDPSVGNKKFLPVDQLSKIFIDKSIDLSKPVITYCNSGITACIGWLALKMAGVKEAKVYPGSWVEYISHKESPVEVT